MFIVNDLRKHLRSAVYGAAVGDALGVPWEFRGREACRCDGMSSGGAHNQPAGTFSDDTSMLLATLDSLAASGGDVDAADMLSRFRSWMRDGAYAVDGNVFDIGITVSSALSSGKGMPGERDNGNGSLMHILPLAFTGAGFEEVAAASSVTHAHRISKEACWCYVEIARGLMSGVPPENAILSACLGSPEFLRLPGIASLPVSAISSGGFVVHTLEAALWCLSNTGSYRDCVLAAVNLGSDTDTTACVAGGLAGVVYGIGGDDGIPADWMDALRGKDIIENVLEHAFSATGTEESD